MMDMVYLHRPNNQYDHKDLFDVVKNPDHNRFNNWRGDCFRCMEDINRSILLWGGKVNVTVGFHDRSAIHYEGFVNIDNLLYFLLDRCPKNIRIIKAVEYFKHDNLSFYLQRTYNDEAMYRMNLINSWTI